MHTIGLWGFFAGLGLFIFGMSNLEKVLKNYSGRSLKLFLRRNTKNVFKAIAGGAIVTGLVQSSSVISLLVLAFVEAGIFSFSNAMGIILGTNIGTTLDSWVIATLGFKYNIQNYVLPLIAISTISMFVLRNRKKIYNIFSLIFSISIIFLGLSMMKENAMQIVLNIDLKQYLNLGIYIFILIGFVITTIIQSSSATIALALTSIYAGVLNFNHAAAIVIGSEVGTTIKILLWGTTGTIEKRRVAIGNFIFNIFTSIIAIFLLNNLIYIIFDIIKIKDPLIGLVFFQTFINFISVIIFIPFLKIFTQFLLKNIKEEDLNNYSFISTKLPVEPMLAEFYFRIETQKLFDKTLNFISKVMKNSETEGGFIENIKSFARSDQKIEEEYKKLKHSEGDLLNYFSKINNVSLTADESSAFFQYIRAVRKLIYAAKSIKDINHDLVEFSASANDYMHNQCKTIEKEWIDFEEIIKNLFKSENKNNYNNEAEKLENEAEILQNLQKTEVLNLIKNNLIGEVEASTLLNVQREILSCKKSLLNAALILILNQNNNKY